MIYEYAITIKHTFDFIAVGIIIIGGIKALLIYLKSFFNPTESATFYFNAFKVKLARSVALALELTIAGDVVATTTDPSYNQLFLLIITIGIRTFINYMLVKDLDDTPNEIRKKISNL